MKGRSAVIMKCLAGRERGRIKGHVGKIWLSTGKKGFVRIIVAAN